jgi:hypothetical protein
MQNVNQSFEDDDHDQLFIFERSLLHETSELINIIIFQIDLKNCQNDGSETIKKKKSTFSKT